MKKDIRSYLADIQESINLIRKYAENLTLPDLVNNQEKQDALIRRLLVIGEAVKGIPEEERKLAPNIKWKKIAGMRDILVHNYDAIIPEEIMNVILNDIEPLSEGIAELEQKLKL